MPAQSGQIPVAANVLGTIGTSERTASQPLHLHPELTSRSVSTGLLFLTVQVFLLTLVSPGKSLWCVQLVPQIWTNWRTKKTDGFPAVMMYLWALCGVPFGVYAIVQKFNVPLQVQPQCFMALCLVSWAQILLYSHNWPVWKASLAGVGMACIFAGVEAALIVTLTPIYSKGNQAPILVIGIVAAVLLAVGLLPPYREIWKRHGRVIGFNWIFLSMDWCGAFFSLMALVAQNTFDITGGVLYIICCLLEAGIFASHIVWRIRTRRIRKAAAAEGKTFDDIIAEHETCGERFKWADRKWKWKWGNRGQKADEEAAAGAAAGAAAYPGEPAEESEYATEDKFGSPREPESPVAVGFPPGMPVERTIEGRMDGEA